MIKHLPLTLEKLRMSIPYNEEKDSYAYTPFEGGGYMPASEIVEISKNDDGSLNLTIDAVSIEFGEDKSMTNIITVFESPDGSIKYLSNKVIVPFE